MLERTIVISVIASLASFVVGTYLGSEYREGKQAQEQVQVLENSIRKANENVQILVKQTESEAKRRKEFDEKTSVITERIIRETLQPIYTTCRITDDSLLDINSAISETNSAIKGSGSLRPSSSSGR